MSAPPAKQLLHLVIGGELSRLDSAEFKDLSKVDLVGVYPNYATAHAAWRAEVEATLAPLSIRLDVPSATDAEAARTGHSDAFRWLWGEFTSVRRSEPGATW